MADSNVGAAQGNSSEGANRATLSRLVIDGGRLAFQRLLAAVIHPTALNVFLNKQHLTLYRLMTRKVITGSQWDLMFPPRGSLPDSGTFDVKLLSALLRSICGLHWPESGCDGRPPRHDQSLEAQVARINYLRNQIHASVTTSTTADHELLTWCWAELTNALPQAGVGPAEIDRIMNENSAVDERLYLGLLREWKMHDEDVKEELEVINRELFQAKSSASSSKRYSRLSATSTSEGVSRILKRCFANKTWFYGKMSREECEFFLETFGKAGEFIVRQSEQGEGDVYVLSVKEARDPLRIGHYLIKMYENGTMSFGVGRRFLSWEKLFTYLESSRVGGSESSSAPFLRQFQKVFDRD